MEEEVKKASFVQLYGVVVQSPGHELRFPTGRDTPWTHLMSLAGPALQELLNAFRARYHRYESAVREAVANSADAVVLWRLGDDLNQYLGLVNEASTVLASRRSC